MFSWVSRHLERVYGEGWVTEAKKDTGKILKLTNKRLVWGKSRPKILDGGWLTYITPEKGEGIYES